MPPDAKPSNEALLNAIQRVTQDDNPENRGRLYRALWQGFFLIPTTDHPPGTPSGFVTLEGQTSYGILLSKNADDEPIAAAFTDEAALGAWKREGNAYIGLQGPDFFRMMLDMNIASVLLNPAGPMGGEITRAEIQFITENSEKLGQTDWGADVVRIGEGSTVSVQALPMAPPLPLAEQLRTFLQSVPEVTGAYLFLMLVEKGPSHFAAGLTFAAQPPDSLLKTIFENLSAKTQPFLAKGTAIDFLILEGELLKVVREIVPPLYLKA